VAILLTTHELDAFSQPLQAFCYHSAAMLKAAMRVIPLARNFTQDNPARLYGEIRP